ncbi:MAG TPA: phosphoglucosamine mutase, partial [Solirubrobacteraceae bacterium]|nr:phosphoglucosamine mutase [Solirubrobacteraceae bacterium]
LEAALAAGVAAAGGDVLLGGVLPTPAAPLLVARYGFDLAAVISASHNPYRDNGIKFFGGDGFKLSDQTEARIEARLQDPLTGTAIGRIDALHGADEDYLRALHTRFAALDLSGRRILLDCANGATHRVAPEIFRRLGAAVTVVADQPDGRNINAGVGSTHVEELDAAGHDAAFAFDGDGDRVLAKDRAGALVDGDELLALAVLRRGAPGVAVTVMTNYGFHAAMREAGVEVATTKVGDRYVLEELRARGWELGGEQSGHLIDMAFVPSGDGIAAALLTLEALEGGDLAERHAMEKLPQRLVNVRVADRDAAMDDEELAEAVERESAGLEGRGRVLVRPSGTEQLVRVMVEAPTAEEADAVCGRLVGIVERSSRARA